VELSSLNPFVRSADLVEVIDRTEERIAYDCRLLYMISGDVTFSVDGQKNAHLEYGNLLYIPSGTRYKIKGQYFQMAVITFDLTGEYACESTKLSPCAVGDFNTEKCHRAEIAPFDKPLFCAEMDSLRDIFERLAQLATSCEGVWREVLSAEVKLILLKLCEAVSENALPQRMVEELDKYISENASDEISNTEIGAVFGYHPFYVSNLLKEKKGITLRQYIIAYRLKAAKKLLENTRRSIAQIAEETGFTDASYFAKAFRQTFGMTPKEWRNKFKEEFI